MDFIAYRKMASTCPISMSMLDLDVPAHPGEKVSITFAKLLGKVALFRQHRDEMHCHEGGCGEQRNPKIVHRNAKSDHKKRNPHIRRIASEAVRALQNQLWRGLPGNRALTCACEPNARRDDQTRTADKKENAGSKADPRSHFERKRGSHTLNNHPRNDCA